VPAAGQLATQKIKIFESCFVKHDQHDGAVAVAVPRSPCYHQTNVMRRGVSQEAARNAKDAGRFSDLTLIERTDMKEIIVGAAATAISFGASAAYAQTNNRRGARSHKNLPPKSQSTTSPSGLITGNQRREGGSAGGAAASAGSSSGGGQREAVGGAAGGAGAGGAGAGGAGGGSGR
jgi:hypothetical protein